MKIALCSSYVPFIDGGYRNIVDWLEIVLKNAGHQVEKIFLPHIDHPDLIFKQSFGYRWVDLSSSADRIICFRPPAHLIPHPHKILWFIHHIRVFYDLWDSGYRTFPQDEKYLGIRNALLATDTAAFSESKQIFTNSQAVSNRLMQFNQIKSEVLYPPLYQPERFYCRSFNDEIVYISRIEKHKRQELLIEALPYTQTPVKLRLCGTTANPEYEIHLRKKIENAGLNGRVIFENKWISESEKINFLADCLAVAYLPFDEDSYGYPSLEASNSGKPVLTTTDSGGVVELINHDFNGYVVNPDPQELAYAMDGFYLDKQKTRQMGENAQTKLQLMNISWDHVLSRLLA